MSENCIECGAVKSPGRGKRLCEECRDGRGDKKAWARAWYHTHKAARYERIRVNDANGRSRRIGTPATLVIAEWIEILEKFGGRCAYCLAEFECLDHVIPLAEGGGTTADNVVPACRNCNTRKSRMTVASKSDWVPSIASVFWPRLAEARYA